MTAAIVTTKGDYILFKEIFKIKGGVQCSSCRNTYKSNLTPIETDFQACP